VGEVRATIGADRVRPERDGLVVSRKNDSERWPWDSVELRKQVVDHYTSGVYARTTHTFRLIRPGSKDIHLTASVKRLTDGSIREVALQKSNTGVADLATLQEIETAIAAACLQRSAPLLQRGEAVTFGVVTLQRERVSVRYGLTKRSREPRVLPLRDLSAVTIDRGNLLLLSRIDPGKPWCKLPVESIGNLSAFVEIMRRRDPSGEPDLRYLI